MKDRAFRISFKINCYNDREANEKTMAQLVKDEMEGWYGKVTEVKVKRIEVKK